MTYIFLALVVLLGWGTWQPIASTTAAMGIHPATKNLVITFFTLAMVSIPVLWAPSGALTTWTPASLRLAALAGLLNGAAFAAFQPLLSAVPEGKKALFLGALSVVFLVLNMTVAMVLNQEGLTTRKMVFFGLAFFTALAAAWAGMEQAT